MVRPVLALTVTLVIAGASILPSAAATGPVGQWTETLEIPSCKLVSTCQGRTAVTLAGPQCRANPSLGFCGEVLLVGSSNGTAAPDARQADLFNPRTGVWHSAKPAPQQRTTPGAVQIDGPECVSDPSRRPCGEVLVIGGRPLDRPDTADLYDPATDNWSAAQPLVFFHYAWFSTVLLNGPRCGRLCGDVLVAAGAGGPVAGTKSEVYDPVRNTWAATGSLATSRNEHITAYLDGPDCQTSAPPGYCGDVLVAGGRLNHPDAFTTATAELFDPTATDAVSSAQGAWQPTGSLQSVGSMPYAPELATSTLLVGPRCASQCGKVLVAGGGGNSLTGTSVYGTAEVYDPAAQSWTVTASLNAPRLNHAGALLPSGEYLVAGGTDPLGRPTASAELYDPSAPGGTWLAASRMPRSTFADTAAVLSPGPGSWCAALCGRALVTGDGFDVAELFEGTPAVGAVAPDPIPLAGGSTVVRGGGFTTVKHITIGSAVIDCPSSACAPDPNSPDTTLTVTFPAHAKDPAVPLLVTNEVGDSPPFDVQYADPTPTVTALSPDCGPTAGGTSVVIDGTHFTRSSSVDVGFTPVAATVLSGTSIGITSPAWAAPARVPVTVTTSGGTSAAATFTYPCPATAGLGTLSPAGFVPPSSVTGAPPPAYPGPPPAAQTLPGSAPAPAAHAAAPGAQPGGLPQVAQPAGAPPAAHAVGGVPGVAPDESAGAPALGYRMVRPREWDVNPALAIGGAAMLCAFAGCLVVPARAAARTRRKAAVGPLLAHVREEEF